MKVANYVLILAFIVISNSMAIAEDSSLIKIGWIGAMSGPIAKYGAYQSAQLAEDDINSSGGINGHKLKLIFEDGKGEGKAAVSAMQKLISVDHLNYVIGGHCSPESLAMAPLAERNKTIMLAAITSSPKLTDAGDYIFRVTQVSTKHSEIIVPYAMKQLGLKKFAIIHEETDYARPPAERFAELVKQGGGEVVDYQSYNPGEIDFRSMLTKMRTKHPQGLYLGVQSPDTAVVFLKQLKELNIKVFLTGNEITGNSYTADPNIFPLFEDMVFAEPAFDLNNPQTKNFVERYKKKFNVDNLPFGFWSAEAYDAVRLLANTISRCGEEVERVKNCLYQTTDYPGVSAPISIDSHGDGVRTYILKKIVNGQALRLN